VNPGATERCDASNTDENCDGAADDATATGQTVWYLDNDGDGYGGSTTVTACDAPARYVAVTGDCDDANGSVPDSITWFQDLDGDGYGNAAVTKESCVAPSGYVASDTDCNDLSYYISPGATEVCDDIDNDCDSRIDDADRSLDTSTGSPWYADDDADGYGDADNITYACELPAGLVTDTSDCDDSDASVNPAAVDIPNDGIDNDCVDGDNHDGDGDGYEDEAWGGADCDDTDSAISPSATEVCKDDIDNNCDGSAGSCSLSVGGALRTGADVRLYDSYASGDSLDTHGDFDGDGISDLLSYSRDYYFSSVALSPLTSGTYSYDFGVSYGSGIGYASDVAYAGDLDGDGDDEMLLGAKNDSRSTKSLNGDVLLYLGGSSGGVYASSFYGRLYGSNSYEYLGCSVSGNGVDVTGDGSPDIIAGAYGAEAAYVMDGAWSGTVAVTTYDAKFTGSSEYFGSDVSLVDDVDGDGIGDVMVGGYNRSSTSGAAYLFLGPVSGAKTTASADAHRYGGSGDALGYVVTGVGDVDGDGLNDMAISSPNDSAYAGMVEVFAGAASPTLTGTPMATLPGRSADSYFGLAVSHGDVDGDGLSEVLVGAPYESSVGAAYVVFGPFSGTMSASDYGRFTGWSSCLAGTSISGGDLNDDGYDDVAIGATGQSYMYVVYGTGI